MSAFMCFHFILPIFFPFLLHKESNYSFFTPDLALYEFPPEKDESFVDFFFLSLGS